MRLSPEQAASRFIAKHFPQCRAALLSGSVVRHDANAKSDLDLIVIDDTQEAFHAAYFEWEWPIESFVLQADQCDSFLQEARNTALPSFPRMCVEGVIIKDDGCVASIIEQAKNVFEKGPIPWTLDEMNYKRYQITECLIDLEGSSHRKENVFVVNPLSLLLCEFILRTNDQWIGDGKWMVRSVKLYDSNVYDALNEALERFYMYGIKKEIIRFSDEILEPYGGRLFEGFAEGSLL